MEVRFSPEQEAQILQVAAHTGTEVEQFVKNATLQVIDEQARFCAAVREGIEQADRGELVENDVVLQWLEGRERC